MRLNVTESGPQQGVGAPAVVLLHGLFGQSRNFATLREALSDRHRVLALDLRDHGDSPHAPVEGYGAMAADVAETLAALGAEGAAVIGHSMGGKVAMRLALDHPAALSRLVVSDIAPVPYAPAFRGHAAAMQALPLHPGLTRREADAALAGAVPEAGVRAFLLQNLDFAAPRWKIGLAEIAAGLPEIEGWEAPAGARWDGPVLVVRGGRSPYVRPEHEPLFTALFPRARFAVVEKAGHWIHAEDPAGFLVAIRPFLEPGGPAA
ncbi:alpha/beta fold hydrolase [Roseomonas sp. OT10]|uniref:alpha/beta fold hydrolase n=1 Tax=Roseomonas cutis TaxID=2897332 RepID=UPI001E53EB43|nr:alpha/beta fold hydrolase [Roseomonas sp. OT10]UFN46814.1 alpha/beta fold hydrolase [Roseomonas sp. OT10]